MRHATGLFPWRRVTLSHSHMRRRDTSVMAGAKQKFYAVKQGRAPGIYLSWEECARQVQGFAGAIYKAFATRAEAEHFLASRRRLSGPDPAGASTPERQASLSTTAKRGRAP